MSYGLLRTAVRECYTGGTLLAITLVVVPFMTGCSQQPAAHGAPYVPIAELQGTYGKLITAGNHPTADQHGTGERVGLFLDGGGRIWGLPLTIDDSGAILGCAPSGLRTASVTDTIPAEMTVIGVTNEPTGWRGGTGKLELLLRDTHGELHSQTVSGGEVSSGPVCWAPRLPGPTQKLQYYLITPANSEK